MALKPLVGKMLTPLRSVGATFYLFSSYSELLTRQNVLPRVMHDMIFVFYSLSIYESYCVVGRRKLMSFSWMVVKVLCKSCHQINVIDKIFMNVIQFTSLPIIQYQYEVFLQISVEKKMNCLVFVSCLRLFLSLLVPFSGLMKRGKLKKMEIESWKMLGQGELLLSPGNEK